MRTRVVRGLTAAGLAVCLAACGDGERPSAPAAPGVETARNDAPSPPALAPSPVRPDGTEGAVPDAELTRVGTLGEWPSASRRVVIALPADGSIVMDGRAWDPRGLAAHLVERTQGSASGRRRDTGEWSVVLRVHPSLPWEVVGWVLQTCAGPSLKLGHVFFAVRPDVGETVGTMATFLPKSGFEPGIGTEPLRVDLASAETRSDDARIFAALQSALASDANGPSARSVVLAVPGRGVASGHVIRVVDLALRAGARDVDFLGTPSIEPTSRPTGGSSEGASNVGPIDPRTWLQRYVAEHPLTGAGFSFRVRGNEAANGGRPPPPLPGVAPVRGLLAGSLRGASAEVEPAAAADAPPEEVESEALLPEEREAVPIDEVAKSPTLSMGDGVTSAGTAREGGIGAPAGPRNARDAVELGLDWLAVHQSPDGGWLADGFGGWCNKRAQAASRSDDVGEAFYDVGVTGLALLAYLGAGRTNRSEGPFGKVVGDGLRYLKNVQDAEGCIGPRTGTRFIYNHALGTLALLDAYGMTGSPIYKAPAQRALDFIALARNPYLAWRYGVKPGENDTSVTGWIGMALLEAKRINDAERAVGKPAPFAIDADALDGIRAWIERVTDPATGRGGYMARGTGSARPSERFDRFPPDRCDAMSAVLALLRLRLGETAATSAALARGGTLLQASPPSWNPNDGSIDMDYWLFGTGASFRLGGETWKVWEAGLTSVLKAQCTEGEACDRKGSWDPIDAWSVEGGRVYSTAMGTLVLEAYYRYDGGFLVGR